MNQNIIILFGVYLWEKFALIILLKKILRVRDYHRYRATLAANVDRLAGQY